MKIDLILSRVDKARKTGPESWIACCPAHEDRSPSMTLREADDGRILMHCFAGCSVESILGSIGLDFDALFPDKPLEHVPPIRRPFPAADVLEALAAESLIAAVAAANVAQGIELTAGDRERLMVAAERIQEGRRLANG